MWYLCKLLWLFKTFSKVLFIENSEHSYWEPGVVPGRCRTQSIAPKILSVLGKNITNKLLKLYIQIYFSLATDIIYKVILLLTTAHIQNKYLCWLWRLSLAVNSKKMTRGKRTRQHKKPVVQVQISPTVFRLWPRLLKQWTQV
jgi:hypothetical protein